ncbi:MAG: hypothetical protein RLZ98_1351 [Pseudomonadota bacterium]|jgi:diguanylate cyclase (GGDEF)-like protein
MALVALLALTALLAVPVERASAMDAIAIKPDMEVVEISPQGEFIEGRGDNVQLQTAPGADGVKGRMTVRAATPGTNPNWLVFALTNASDQPIERWLTVERYTLIGSGIVWPDLDAKRIEAVTPSIGFLPERVKNDRADIFRITLEPRQTVTYAVELASDRFPRAELWTPLIYELRARDRQLFNGIMLGITGVLGIFLTAVFAANHKAIFPCAALVTWCVLAYLCVDFGFWHKLLQLRAEDNAVYRAATESAMAASFVIFLHVFLRLGAWHGFMRMLLGVWIVAQLGLVAIAVIDPRLAATFARASFAGLGAIGALFILYLTLRRQDRALSLLPTWMLFMVWIFAAAMVLTGKLAGPIVVSSLVAGLVLVVVLVGFAVTQFAFRSVDTMDSVAPSEQLLRSLAIEGSGAAVWEWNARRQEIKVSPGVEAALDLPPGALSTRVDDFLMQLHDADRERFRLMLWSAQERGGGDLLQKFRIRHADGTYRWFDLEAAAMKSSDRHSLRCVGLMRDITEAKRSQERLLHDAVHDSLTGLPNRALFIDRVSQAMIRTGTGGGGETVLFIDIDKFKSANSSFGLTVGDSLLLTVAKRLEKHIGPNDTLGRVAGDQFAILFVEEQDPTGLAMRAERIRRSLRAPIRITGQDIVLTASIGIAVNDGSQDDGGDLLRDAEIAMYRAKRNGADKVELFEPHHREDVDDRLTIESDLRQALERNEIQVLYQPIIYLATEELAGFEALVRWQHPRVGMINPDDFLPVAEQTDLIVRLGSYVLSRAVQDAARWHKELPRSEKQLFVSVNVSSRQLLRPELIQEVRQIIGRQVIPPQTLKLEITESLVMENPEQAAEALEVLRATGAGIAIDDFGTGYSSLSYLQRFPVDTLKIDRDLVQSGQEGPGSAIVRSIVALSHELGKKVVAEGVEASSDVGFLRSIGCEYAQGFYYGGAMPMSEVLKFLKMVSKSERALQRRGLFTINTRRKSGQKRSPEQQPKDSGMPVPNGSRGVDGSGVGGPSAYPPAVPAGSDAAGANSLMRTRPRRPQNGPPPQRPAGAETRPPPQQQPARVSPPQPPRQAAGHAPPPQHANPGQAAVRTGPPTVPVSVQSAARNMGRGDGGRSNGNSRSHPAGANGGAGGGQAFDATARAVGSIASVLSKFGGNAGVAGPEPGDGAGRLARERAPGQGEGANGQSQRPPVPPQRPDISRGPMRPEGRGEAGDPIGQTVPPANGNGTRPGSTTQSPPRRNATLPPALQRSLEKLAGDKKN